MTQGETMQQGLDRYLAENGFTIDDYGAPSVTISVGPIVLRLPNSPARQRAIPLHDLHHVLTGYGTDLVGEAEIGAWELRAGCNTPFLFMINLTAVAIGLVLAPRRVWRAWRAARTARSLYLDVEPAAAYLALAITEPDAQIVAGFDAGVMSAAVAPQGFGTRPQDIEALVAYIEAQR